MTQIRCYETTGRPVFITVVLHRRIPYLKNLEGQVAPQALPDAYETTKFLFRLDWTLAGSGDACPFQLWNLRQAETLKKGRSAEAECRALFVVSGIPTFFYLAQSMIKTRR